MRKIVAAINMTLDGFCDHTAGEPDEEIHEHYTELLKEADAILYGRITYELMKFWQDLLKHPSGEKTMDDFALTIDKIPKIVFSNTFKGKGPDAIGWDSAELAHDSIEKVVSSLKQSANRESKDILVGSRSLIIQLLKMNLIDEFQLCIYPVLVGSGLPLFEKITDKTLFKLIKTKTFKGGAVILYYEPLRKNSES